MAAEYASGSEVDAATAEHLARRLYVALAAGDREGTDALLHPGFIGRTTAGLPLELGGTYDGPEAMRRDFWWRIGRSYVARAKPLEFGMLEDGRLVVFGQYEGAAREGGALNAEFVHVLSFAEGRISGLHQLTDSARWRDALAGGSSAVEFAVEDGLAMVRLNRPAARNGFDQVMADGLLEVAQRCADDANLRAVLISGNGPVFTVGGDVTVFTETDPAELPLTLRRMATSLHEAIRLLSELDVPVVTAVHGNVVGAGLGLLYCADIAIAAEGTKFVSAFGALGLPGDGANTWYLPRLVGLRRAQDFYFRRRVLDAAEALEWGLVTEVVAADRLGEHAQEVARSLAEGPTRAYGEFRGLLRDSWHTGLPEQLAKETDAVGRMAQTRDLPAAARAFLTKTEPKFEGR